MSPEVRLLSQADWKKLYPREIYETKSIEVKSLLIHYLLALNQPDEVIISAINSKKHLLLTVDLSTYGFTSHLLWASFH